MHLPRPKLSLADDAESAESTVEARHDARLRDIVDDGLALMRALGILPALEFLKARGVGAQVITRVLLEPERRRSSPALFAA